MRYSANVAKRLSLVESKRSRASNKPIPPADTKSSISIVAGIRGDAPEGIRVAYHLLQTLKDLQEDIKGIIDLYPCVNPLAVEQGQRYWPFFDIDLNRIFPGQKSGHPPHQLAYHLVRDMTTKVHRDRKEEHIVVELRGARPSFQILPQALVRSGDDYAQCIQ